MMRPSPAPKGYPVTIPLAPRLIDCPIKALATLSARAARSARARETLASPHLASQIHDLLTSLGQPLATATAAMLHAACAAGNYAEVRAILVPIADRLRRDGHRCSDRRGDLHGAAIILAGVVGLCAEATMAQDTMRHLGITGQIPS
jgi:hypothetical protein